MEEKEGFERNAVLLAAKEAINADDDSRKRFEIMARAVFAKFKACLTSKDMNSRRPAHAAINFIYRSLEEDREAADISDIIDAMDSIEADYETLKGALPKQEYQELDNEVLGSLLRAFNDPALKRANGDIFGRIYEYFLTQFADQKAHDCGEFFTPVSIVQMIVNVIEPEHGRVFPPRFGSVGSITSLTFKNRLYAWRRKISPITGMKYSLLAKFKLERNISALDHSRRSISPMCSIFSTSAFFRKRARFSTRHSGLSAGESTKICQAPSRRIAQNNFRTGEPTGPT